MFLHGFPTGLPRTAASWMMESWLHGLCDGFSASMSCGWQQLVDTFGCCQKQRTVSVLVHGEKTFLFDLHPTRAHTFPHHHHPPPKKSEAGPGESFFRICFSVFTLKELSVYFLSGPLHCCIHPSRHGTSPPWRCRPKLHQAALMTTTWPQRTQGRMGQGSCTRKESSEEHSSMSKFNGLVIRVFSPGTKGK